MIIKKNIISVIISVLLLSITYISYAENNIIYLFSHSLSYTKEVAYSYAKENLDPNKIIKDKKYIMEKNIKTFDYPDATRRFWRLTMFYTSLGQDNEIGTLKKAYDEILEENPDAQIILVGRCRGACVILGFLGTYNPKNVAAAIVESPFDDITKVFKKHWFIKAVQKYTGLSKKCIYRLFVLLSSHDPNGKKPIDYTQEIEIDIPILIVCKKTDNSVPFSSTERIYNTLKFLGKEKTHLLVLNDGIHGKLLWTSEGSVYQDCVHAFYKYYELPCNKDFAQRGGIIFENIRASG